MIDIAEISIKEIVASHVFANASTVIASLKRLGKATPCTQSRSPREVLMIKKQNRNGRPKLAPESVRSKTIGVRVNPSEMAELEDKAKAMGVLPAHYLRIVGLAKRLPPPPVPAVNREEYAKLGRLAANLNQLTRQMNSHDSVDFDRVLMGEIKAELNALRLALILKKEGKE